MVVENGYFCSMKEYKDLTNLQQLIQQKQTVNQSTWDTEQKEYVEGLL